MTDERLRAVVDAMIQDAAQRLMSTGARGVVIALIHEDDMLPLGTCMMDPSATARDLVLGLGVLNNTQKILVNMILNHLRDDRRTSGAREGSTGVGSAADVGDIPDGSSPSYKSKDPDSQPAAKEAASEQGGLAGGRVGDREDGDDSGNGEQPDSEVAG